ncbi:MAG: rhodanese-like domain-containing protein [Rhodoferax sp.]
MVVQIRPSQLRQWFDSTGEARPGVVLDVREPGEWALASVEPDGFELLSIPMGVVPVRLTELDRTRPIACLCHHGARSMQVANFLHSQGFAQVANIAGGIDAWATDLDPRVARY